jgi:uncharacterized protein YgbK (DUF1537 family)
MRNHTPLTLGYYGDDFTGSTDALEALTRAGLRTVLFLDPPTVEDLEAFPGINALGIAGHSRSLPVEEMEAVLQPAFQALKALGPRHVHYKVCSTFDSSPWIGSIGKAIETGRGIFKDQPCVPVLVGAPALGRYCVFGNLFAQMGTGGTGPVYRLDRHPSASRHPITPATDSDLRAYLGAQTRLCIGILDIRALSGSHEDINLALRKEVRENGADIVVIDLLAPEQEGKIGKLLECLIPDEQLFSVGSSGIESSLGAHWADSGEFSPVHEWPQIEPVDRLLVLSGSQSPVTVSQIRHAQASGFADLPLDTVSLALDPQFSLDAIIEEAARQLADNRPVIINTCSGEDDPRIPQTREAFVERGLTPDQIKEQSAGIFGYALGRIGARLHDRGLVQRILVAGGDTASFAGRGLGLSALEMIAPLAPGAPLCRAWRTDRDQSPIEVNFKGGQVGAEGYFPAVRDGKL